MLIRVCVVVSHVVVIPQDSPGRSRKSDSGMTVTAREEDRRPARELSYDIAEGCGSVCGINDL